MSVLKSSLRLTSALGAGAAAAAGAQTLNLVDPELFKIPVDLAFGVGATMPLLEGLIFKDHPVRSQATDIASFKYAQSVKNKL